MTENFKLVSVAQAPRTELHDQLGLTGCEVSINSLPAGAAVCTCSQAKRRALRRVVRQR